MFLGFISSTGTHGLLNLSTITMVCNIILIQLWEECISDYNTLWLGLGVFQSLSFQSYLPYNYGLQCMLCVLENHSSTCKANSMLLLHNSYFPGSIPTSVSKAKSLAPHPQTWWPLLGQHIGSILAQTIDGMHRLYQTIKWVPGCLTWWKLWYVVTIQM